MRGRLIEPAIVEIQQFDSPATRANNSVPGVPSGFDEAFGEIAVVEDIAGNRQSLRVNKAPLFLLAQMSVVKLQKVQAAAVGVDRASIIECTFHFEQLEEDGLIDPDTGEAMLRAGDQLVAEYDRDMNLVRRFRKPELYANEPRDSGTGLGGSRNILIVQFATRDIGPQST